MKRSEMVKLMTNIYLGLHRGGWAEAPEEDRMEVVLTLIEKLGMIPPAYKTEKHDSEYDPETRSFISVEVPVHEWEPEDKQNDN